MDGDGTPTLTSAHSLVTEQPAETSHIGPFGPEIAENLIELLKAVPYDLESFRDVSEPLLSSG